MVMTQEGANGLCGGGLLPSGVRGRRSSARWWSRSGRGRFRGDFGGV